MSVGKEEVLEVYFTGVFTSEQLKVRCNIGC